MEEKIKKTNHIEIIDVTRKFGKDRKKIKIAFQEKEYLLIKTKNNKLILN